MLKFSTQNKTQPTPPVCKGVPPPPTPTLPPPGGTALAMVFYKGQTTGVPVDAAAVVPLANSGGPSDYAGAATTPAGDRLELLCTITHDPPFASCTLIGQAANGDFFSSAGSSDQISYDPYLNAATWSLAPFATPAVSGMSLTQ